MEAVITSIVLIAVGFCIGILSGMLGIGGGTLIIPALRLGYGVSAFVATATSLFSIIPISAAGLITHIRGKTSIIKLGLIMGISGAITSSFGVYLNSISPAWLIMLAAAAILVYSAFTMLSKAIKMGKTQTGVKPASNQVISESKDAAVATLTEYHFETSAKNVVVAICSGLIAGLASGYVGVGGGFIMVPLMVAWLHIPMKMTSGTSLLAIIILAIPGVIQQGLLGNIDYLAGLMICIGAIPGAIFGAKLLPRIPERNLRFIFAALLGVAAIMLVLNEFVFA